MNPQEFEKKVSAWLSDAKNASSAEFAAILAAASTALGMFQRDLAVEFEVAESTVSRWAKGTARPHPRIQKQIVRSLQRRVNKLITPPTPRPARVTGQPFNAAPIPLAAKP